MVLCYFFWALSLALFIISSFFLEQGSKQEVCVWCSKSAILACSYWQEGRVRESKKNKNKKCKIRRGGPLSLFLSDFNLIGGLISHSRFIRVVSYIFATWDRLSISLASLLCLCKPLSVENKATLQQLQSENNAHEFGGYCSKGQHRHLITWTTRR